MKKKKIHWSLCPHINDGYRDRKWKMNEKILSLVNHIKRDGFDAEFEMRAMGDETLKKSLKKGYLIEK